MDDKEMKETVKETLPSFFLTYYLCFATVKEKDMVTEEHTYEQSGIQQSTGYEAD